MQRRGHIGVGIGALLGLSAVSACDNAGAREGIETEQSAYAATANIDTFRSLVVTEAPILARFPFERVMNQLAAQSGVAGATGLGLFQQWWDTQNPAPGALGTGPHCDSQSAHGGGPGINGYPYLCRPAPAEGGEATSNPFADPASDSAYLPIGLFNRFDLAPADGSNCGEHRIVYARRSGIDDARNRNLIIFEATMPNPKPEEGLRGCDKIVKFWADLSKVDDITKRADDLERFYFVGDSSLPPVVNIAHFGDNPTGVGQIRTNQFMQPSPITPPIWNLREFKVLRTCAAGVCTAVKAIPVTVKTNPFGPLFSATSTHPQKGAFDAHFPGEVSRLDAASIAGIDMKIPDTFNSPQSLANGSIENNYVAQFAGASALRSAVQAALTAQGSSLTPDDIAKRATAMSCAGCHQLSGNPPPTNPTGNQLGGGLVWPASLGFVHISEQNPITGADGVARFQISPALINNFLPVRKQVMEDFLDNKPPKTKDPKDPIGGRRVH